MIVVEGPDGAGKSTLVGELCERLGLHEGGRIPKSDRDSMYKVTRQRAYTSLGHAISGENDPLIYDRWFWSEIIYGTPQRGHTAFSQREAQFVAKVSKAAGIPLILCLPRWEIVKRNCENTPQWDEATSVLPDIYARYSRLANGLTVRCERRNAPAYYVATSNVKIYDYTQHSIDLLVIDLERYLMGRRARTWRL